MVLKIGNTKKKGHSTMLSKILDFICTTVSAERRLVQIKSSILQNTVE